MTETITPLSSCTRQSTTPMIHYQVAMSQPQTHLLEVRLDLRDFPGSVLDLKFPVWTPGSYLVREYARHLQDFAAVAGDIPLNWHKICKNHWQVDTQGQSHITVTYRIFANELSVRTNHLDQTHGYFNGAATFFRIVGLEGESIDLTVIPPTPEWRVTTALPLVDGSVNTYRAIDFDTLVDSPVEVGTHPVYQFEVLGKPHELAIWGQGNYDVQRIITDIQSIITTEAEMFGGLPYERYVFLLHLFAQAYGGLEHKDCCSLIYQRFGFRDREKYEKFMQLVAHEFFHLWNVKRIRPQALEVFDYDNENYTPSLWFCEGTTSFYDLLIPLRAGIYDVRTFFNNWSKEINRYLKTPGRNVQPLAESSFDAWVKLYRSDSNSINSQMSYYLKGEMVSLLLDLLIRDRHHNTRSLDDVMVHMWEQFGKDEIGYTSEQLQQVIENVAGVDLSAFFNQYIQGLEELPFNTYLEPFGLHLFADISNEPYIGIRSSNENGREIVKAVEAGSPANQVGIDPNDEILAIDGIKLKAGGLNERLKDYQVGDEITITLFHQDELRNYQLKLGDPTVHKYYIGAIENPTPSQQEKFYRWLDVPIHVLKN